jgi:hypothetical protein
VVAPSGARAIVRPIGAAEVGLLAALVGAWGALSVFVGPIFGYQPTSATSWDWTMQNWLLHLVPGAVAVFAGVIILVNSPARRVIGRGPLALGSLLLVAAGSWFVLGPVAWPIFESSPPFATGVDATTNFVNQLGSSLGPGLLLAMLGGMAMKAGIARPAVELGEAAPATAAPVVAAEEPVAGGTTARTAAAPVEEPATGRTTAAPAGDTSETMVGGTRPGPAGEAIERPVAGDEPH